MQDRFELPPRTVYLPLKSIDKCCACGVTSNTTQLRICPCESIYCSEECQKRDWKSHRVRCGKSARLDLGAFYPVFAIAFEKFHSHAETGFHPALLHTIVNNPHPNEYPTKLPGGCTARVVLLGDPLRDQRFMGSSEWWPSAPTAKVRSKLFRRITREGNLLVKVVAVCMGILAEFYTTTSSADKKTTRYRLCMDSAPIVDFGIACGPVRVTHQDKLAYWYLEDDTIVKGQNPDDHYWIYFTTTHGQVFTLECGMFTFNMCTVIDTTPYHPPGNNYWSSAMMPFAPAFFRNKELQKNSPDVHREKRRFSVLRDTSLHEAIAQGLSAVDAKEINAFAARVAGRKCTEREKKLLPLYTMLACNGIGEVLQSKIYRRFPKHPTMAIEQDPNELDDMEKHSDKYWEYLQNWKKLKKEGKTGNQTIKDAFREYQRLYVNGGKPGRA